MNKRCAIALAAAVAGWPGAEAWAARETLEIDVSVTVPTRAFYVLPAEPGWIHRQQVLPWNYPDSTLGGFSKNFDVRHDTSAIEARLESVPYLSTGRAGEEIALRVRFNSVELSADPGFRQVLTKAEAAAGKRVPLEIDPVVPAGGYKAGDYSGNVLLLFNATAPAG
ncbi:fimbrial assembly protein [Pseudomonas sp. NPDC089534]|uniref:fimbrial assembly protein n=1 Tax=Pseudomonas sp. NPDC089534 TaxID=3364468 RepID=UPI0037FED245